MKQFYFILLLSLLSSAAHAQLFQSDSLQFFGQGNHVEKMHSDSNCSSFMIWVNHEVKPHRHNYHSEHVYVIEGEGNMLLGEELIQIKEGDIIAIPEGTIHAVKPFKGITLKVISIQSPEFKGKDREFIALENWLNQVK